MARQHVNLISAARRETRQCRRHAHRWVAACAIYAGLAIAAAIGFRMSGRGDSRVAAEDLNQLQARLNELNRTAAGLRSELASAKATRQTVSSLVGAPDWSDLLILVRGLCAGDTNVHEVRIDAIKPQATTASQQVRPDEYTVSFSGTCSSLDQITRIVARFEGAGVFEDVKLLRSRREGAGDDARVAFDLACTLREIPRAAK